MDDQTVDKITSDVNNLCLVLDTYFGQDRDEKAVKDITLRLFELAHDKTIPALITEDERAVMQALAAAWNAFLGLPGEHPDDVNEFRHAIHVAQNIVLSRVGRRQIAS